MDRPVSTTSDRKQLIKDFTAVRQHTELLCKLLAPDDYQTQSMPQTSPPKWHLAHVSWFFETFVLAEFTASYRSFHPEYDFLFNSYYQTHGRMQPRSQRGLLSRPTIEEIYQYRRHIDEKIQAVMASASDANWFDVAERITLGLHHEQQHQELLLMDIKHNFWSNPLHPAYRDDLVSAEKSGRPINWLSREGGIYRIGHSGDGFVFDNETPRHERLLRNHLLADRFITNEEYLQFIEDGAYNEPALWLSDGWDLISKEGWEYPLYWSCEDRQYRQFSLSGMRELVPREPVCHLSYFEADAYARWAGKRLPQEEELEVALAELPVTGNFVGDDCLHPSPAGDNGQWYGDVWAWTASAYSAYPGYRPSQGTLGEYNGKFMSGQMVLKGGSCVTPASHTRATYRNFYYPHERWAFTGLRLADDVRC